MTRDPAPTTRIDGSPSIEARGWSWPPFAQGHTLSVKSGAWSERLITETMEELRPSLQAVLEQAVWIRPIDEHAMFDYLRDMARLERLERWLETNGDRYPDGHKNAGELRDRDLREVGALRRRCMDHRSRLGLDPASRVRLAVERKLGVDLAVAMAEIESAEHADQPESREVGGDAGEVADGGHGDERVTVDEGTHVPSVQMRRPGQDGLR